MEIPNIKVGLIGCGTIGTGVVKLFLTNASLIAKRSGIDLQLKTVASKIWDRAEGVDFGEIKKTGQADDIFDDPEIDIVIELIGGLSPARDFIIRALKSGKSVVTANKSLLAEHGPELFALAEDLELDLGYEASVGGAIPIIRGLQEGLAANRIENIYGILNGTTNFILSKMAEEGREYKEVLAQAQEIGYAEADPTYDVQGIDASQKLAILAGLAYGAAVDWKKIYREGITRIKPIDLAYARELGYVIKLLGISGIVDGKLDLRVHPTMIPNEHPLAQVSDAYNAVFVKGNMVGSAMFYGPGAGELPTAGAVVADVIRVARNRLEGRTTIPMVYYNNSLILHDHDYLRGSCYLRFFLLDMPGVLSQLSGELGECGIGISSVLQKERREGKGVPVIIMTHPARERDLQIALNRISTADYNLEKPFLIRISKNI